MEARGAPSPDRRAVMECNGQQCAGGVNLIAVGLGRGQRERASPGLLRGFAFHCVLRAWLWRLPRNAAPVNQSAGGPASLGLRVSKNKREGNRSPSTSTETELRMSVFCHHGDPLYLQLKCSYWSSPLLTSSQQIFGTGTREILISLFFLISGSDRGYNFPLRCSVSPFPPALRRVILPSASRLRGAFCGARNKPPCLHARRAGAGFRVSLFTQNPTVPGPGKGWLFRFHCTSPENK